MENKTEEEMVYLLVLIYKLMHMYTQGTRNEINHKDSKGKYVIIDFIKSMVPILKKTGVYVHLPSNDSFIDSFFKALFDHVTEEDK